MHGCAIQSKEDCIGQCAKANDTVHDNHSILWLDEILHCHQQVSISKYQHSQQSKYAERRQPGFHPERHPTRNRTQEDIAEGDRCVTTASQWVTLDRSLHHRNPLHTYKRNTPGNREHIKSAQVSTPEQPMPQPSVYYGR